MKISKEEFKKQILLLATEINLQKSFQMLLNENESLPRMSEMLVYELFVNDYNNYIQTTDTIFEAYYHLKHYCKELKKYGWVEFKN